MCWDPDCNNVDQTVELVIAARDVNDCPNHNYALDTVFVNIGPPPPAQPEVGYDLTNTPAIADTIILEVDQSMCFDWWVSDTLGHELSW